MHSLLLATAASLILSVSASTNAVCAPYEEMYKLTHPRGRAIWVKKSVSCDIGFCQISWYTEDDSEESGGWEMRQLCDCDSTCDTCPDDCDQMNPLTLIRPAQKAEKIPVPI